MDKVFNAEEKIKLTALFNECIPTMVEIETLSGGLADTIKAVAEEMEVKPSILKKALRTAHKSSLGTANQDHDAVNTILELVGRTL